MSIITRIGIMNGSRARRFVATLLISSVLAPLLAGVAAAASASCCTKCPEPVAAARPAPCHGSLFLSCCDDVATAPEADSRRYESRCAEAGLTVVRAVSNGYQHQVTPQVSAEIAWLTSPLRRSVVIRT